MLHVVVLAGIEFTFFIVPGTELCFGVSLMLLYVFNFFWEVLTQKQDFPCTTSKDTENPQEVGGGTKPRQLTATGQGIFHTLWCCAQHIDLDKKEGIGGHSKCWHLSTQVTVTCDGVWFFLEMPAQEKWWMNFLLCHAYVALASPIKLFLNKFSCFHPFDSLHIPSGRSEWAAVWSLVVSWS